MKDFNNIPQEKFDNMNKAMARSINPNEICWPLKVKAIDIQNIKNIDYINTTFSDWVVVNWKNANGKTSFIDSIFLALKWSSLYWMGTEPARIIKHGENKAVISLILRGEEKEITVERTFWKPTKSKPAGTNKLEAYFEDGSKVSQDQLKQLINVLTVDPLALDKLNVPDSIKEVQAITWLDTSEIDKEITKAEEERKFEKQELSKLVALVDESTKLGVPEEIKSVNINELLEVQEKFNGVRKNKDILEEKKEIFKKAKHNVQYFEEQLAQAKKEMEEAKIDGKNFKESIEQAEFVIVEEHGTEEANTEALKNAQETNEKASTYTNYLKQVKDRDEVKKWVDSCEKEVQALRDKKIEMIKASKMPDYMEVSQMYGVLVDGIEYKQLNTARKIEVAIDLVLISGSPLRVLNIEEGGELDFNTLSKVQDKVLEAGFQIFIQRAKVDEFGTVIINEGELVEDEEEKKKLIEENKAEEKEILDKLNK